MSFDALDSLYDKRAFDLSTLNEEQIKPVLDTEGAVLVTAGAGSGKTRLLTHRIAHLIVDKGVPPYNILAITFTNKAANEMKERLERMVPSSRGLWVSTFHSMCVSFLRKYIEHIGYTKNFSIYAENEKERTVKKIVKKIHEEKPGAIGEDDIGDLTKAALYHISSAKNDGFDSEEFYENNKFLKDCEIIRDIFLEYEKELKSNNALDFDDLLNKAYFLLSTVKEAREYYSERFCYVHVDEFQDTNTIQYKIVRLLAQKHKNILIVGDEDQSIYGWRGASITNMHDFTSDFECKIYKLEQNYRSTDKILNLANRLIQNNSSRIKKSLWTNKKDGEDVQIFSAQSETAEADFVATTINSLVRYSGFNYKDFAILMRINALTRPFEEKFIQYQMPHKIFGGFKFYERKEIKDVLAYFRIVANPSDNEAIERVINFPKRGIGDAAVAQIKNYSFAKGFSLFEAIMSTLGDNDELPPALLKKIKPFAMVLSCLNEQKETLKLSELLRYLTKLINLKEAFAADTEENENRKQNIRELLSSVEQYETLNPEAEIEDYLQNVSLYSDIEEMNEESCINIATVHSSKGLEFKVVFVVGLEDGIFPITRAMDSLAEMEEERRLMYVAITRAMDKLYLTNSQTRFLHGERKYSLPSRFLSELGFAPQRKHESAYTNYNDTRWYNREKASYTNNQETPRNTASTYEPIVKKTADASMFSVGTIVKHKKFGEGKVLSISGDDDNLYAEIEFDAVGKLLLSLNYAPLEVIK